MIYPTMPVSWIDLHACENHTATFDEFIVQYAHLGKPSELIPECMSYNFKNKDDIVIQEGLGWSQLVMVYKHPIAEGQDWYRIDAFNKHVIVTGDQIVPVYDPSRNTRGFHGELKYHVTPTRTDDLAHFSMLRQRDLHSGEFDYIKCVSAYWKSDTDKLQYGYTVRTLSGYFNLKGIHMLCWDDHLPPDVL